MAYFSNGSEGMDYEEAWCSKCIHQNGCAVWSAHMFHNYDEANKPEIILHMLIPIDKDGNNLGCTMFSPSQSDEDDVNYDESEYFEVSIREVKEAATLAKSLLEKSGWSGADREFLERLVDEEVDDPASPQTLQERPKHASVKKT